MKKIMKKKENNNESDFNFEDEESQIEDIQLINDLNKKYDNLNTNIPKNKFKKNRTTSLISPINNLAFSFNNNNNIYDKVKNKTKNNINLYNFPYKKKSSNLENIKFKLKYKDVLFEILSTPKNQKSERNHFNELIKKN